MLVHIYALNIISLKDELATDPGVKQEICMIVLQHFPVEKSLHWYVITIILLNAKVGFSHRAML